MLAHYEQQLLEKENSGCAALLRDDKVPASNDTQLRTSSCWEETSRVARLLCAAACSSVSHSLMS